MFALMFYQLTSPIIVLLLDFHLTPWTVLIVNYLSLLIVVMVMIIVLMVLCLFDRFLLLFNAS